MAAARLDIQQIINNFQHCYQKSLLECALGYLESGDEQMTATIGLRAQYIKPTLAEIKELTPLIKQLQDKEFGVLSTREAVILGNAYEYGICVPKDYKEAHKYYLAGADRANPKVEEAVSNRDRGQSLANACSLYYSETDGFKNAPEEGLELAQRAAALGSQLGWAHLGAFYSHFRQYTEACEALVHAPIVFFAHGRLAQILDNEYDVKQNKARARYHYEQAANLGCSDSLLELASYYKSEPQTHKRMIYLASIILAGRETVSFFIDQESKRAKANCQSIANENLQFFNELSNDTPWERLEIALGKDSEVAAKLLDIKTHEIACIDAELDSNDVPTVLRRIIESYCYEPTTIEKATKSENWQNHFSFWKTESAKSQVTNLQQQDQNCSSTAVFTKHGVIM